MFTRRFRTAAGVAVTLVLAGATLDAGPAAAQSQPITTEADPVITRTKVDRAPGMMYQAASEPVCDYAIGNEVWGGRNLCNYPAVDHTFPDGVMQVFVVGTDFGVWSRWRQPNGTLLPRTGWYNLGGQVKRGNPANSSDFAYTRPKVFGSANSPEIYIWGNTTGFVSYFRVRSTSGIWTPWARGND